MNKSATPHGLTLIELLVSLAIISIVAAGALPYAENITLRGKEMELRHALREIRGAIDRCHADWVEGRVAKTAAGISDEGYPKTLDVLVTGVERADAKGGVNKYLRRVPTDPFADGKPAAEPWALRGYQDAADTQHWNGRDVYDVHTRSNRQGIDGTRYSTW